MTANPGPREFDAWHEAMSQKYDPHLFHTRSTLLVRLLEAERVNEWHLHEFDRAMLSTVLQPYLRIERLRCLPIAALPVHYVALGRRRNLPSAAIAGAGSR